MTRVRTLFTLIIPSMLAGGLVFGSAFGEAAHGRDEDLGASPVSSETGESGTARRAPPRRTAQAPTPPRPPRPPAPPNPFGGVPPVPPVPPAHGKGVSVSIHDGKVDISGIAGMVRGQLDGVRQMLRNNPNIPRDVRDKLLARLDKASAIVDKRLSRIKVDDLDQLGEEMEAMGEELEKAMEGLEKDMEKLGDKLGKDLSLQLGKDFGKNFGPKGDFDFKFNFGNDDDDDDDIAAIPMSPDLDADDDDLRDAIGDLKDLALKPAQKAQITKLRTDSDRTVAAAKQQLDAASDRLEEALGNPRSSDADIARYVDQISAHEAAIRKARILAWVNARRVLDDVQRKKIEAAAKKPK
jgi:hypothetical protein